MDELRTRRIADVAAAIGGRLYVCGACRFAVIDASSRPLHCIRCGRTNSYRDATTAATQPSASTGARVIPFPGRRDASSREDAAGVPNAANDVTAHADPPENAPAGQSEARRYVWAAEVEPEIAERAETGLEWWARVTGELARHHVTLLGGLRGIGKSTLALQIAGAAAKRMRRPVLYVGAELTADKLREMSDRVGNPPDVHRPGGLAFLETAALEDVHEVARELRPCLVVVDALKVATVGDEPCEPGSIAERRALHSRRGKPSGLLLDIARDADAACVAVLHNQANGEKYSVGSATLQGCDAIFRLDLVLDESLRTSTGGLAVRLSCDQKNRYGRSDATALLEKDASGRLIPHPKDRP